MNIKNLRKLLIIALLIIMVINNISYAVNISKDDLKKSITHLFASDVKITTKSETEGFNGSSSFTYTKPTELKVTDNQIILKEVEELDGEKKELVHTINYSLNANKATFEIESKIADFLEGNETEEEMAWLALALLMTQSSCMNMGYLAVAEVLNIDLNTAATYFDQTLADNTPEESNEGANETITCDLFSRTVMYDDEANIVKCSIEINIDEVSKINESLLDGTVTTTVEFINEYKENENNNESKNENINNNVVDNTIKDDNVNNTNSNIVNNTVNNTTNNTVNNTSNKVANNTVNNTSNKVVNNTVKNTSNKVNNVVNNSTTKPVDNTTSNKIIPAAGSETIYYILMSVVVMSILIYIKLRKYDDVK